MTDNIDIERLIPHRPPMRLVEAVAKIDDLSIECAATVRESWPTAHAGQARTLMLVELIAQTAAVLQGWKERHQKEVGEGGLLVGIHGARFAAAAIPVGTQLCCAVRISHGAQSYLAFDGEVRDDQGTLWLTGSIQAFRPEGPLPQANPGEPA
jgi:predicted hotdog family 3-hydroxylacyl-ACP dehydratase